MDDLIKSLKAHLYDRTTSPLSGAFILSWLFCNWEIVLVTISDSYIYDKLFHLRNLIKESGIWNLLINPLLGTAFFILIYPHFSNWAYKVSRWHQIELKKIRVKYDDETPISKEESTKLRAEIIKARDKHETEIEKLLQIIQTLEQKDPEIQAEKIHQLTSQNSANFVENKHPEETYRILKLIHNDHKQFKNKIIEKLVKENNINELKVKVIVEELITREFIKSEQSLSDLRNDDITAGLSRLVLTRDGEKLLLEFEDGSRTKNTKSKGYY